ncbi:hypothetical protein O181_058400 [Austropuccinia psidii MF-1]|uniref:Uncharacterized protein n=1 Tax=Austropuccinia psidii MF-1 TaxID=1389203 RepID=A0A9Q3E9L8_9BASI|nr:hypothetical protein [Austropuccinia psidii MF-1]
MDEPPIPGPSPSSEPHEEVSTDQPEPEGLRHNPWRDLLLVPLHPTPSSPLTICPSDPPPSQCQAPLIPTMTLARNLPPYDQP